MQLSSEIDLQFAKNALGQHTDVTGMIEMNHGTIFPNLAFQFRRGVVGYHDGSHTRIAGHQQGQVESILLRQLNAKDQKMDLPDGQNVQGFLHAKGGNDVEKIALALKQPRQGVQHDGIVIDDKNVFHGRLSSTFFVAQLAGAFVLGMQLFPQVKNIGRFVITLKNDALVKSRIFDGYIFLAVDKRSKN